MHEQLKSFLTRRQIPFEELVPMAKMTSFQTGGVARILIRPANEMQTACLLKELDRTGQDWFVLGKGSNLLAPDGMIERILIRLNENEPAPRQIGDEIECAAGYSLMKLCRFAQSRGLSGLEFAYGIPGTLGGAVFMNAGAYGGEMADLLVSCSFLLPDGTRMTLPAEELELGYRTSLFQKKKAVITGAKLRLKPDNGLEIEARMKGFMERRKEKQPLEFPSAGSTFKRPVGFYAGALIEECGLKGLTVGGAQVSEKHAGFCINKDHATTSDVLQLIEQVQKTVFEKKGVRLECEVRLINRY